MSQTRPSAQQPPGSRNASRNNVASIGDTAGHNPDVDPKTHAYIATGMRDNKFGVDIQTASVRDLITNSITGRLVGVEGEPSEGVIDPSDLGGIDTLEFGQGLTHVPAAVKGFREIDLSSRRAAR